MEPTLSVSFYVFLFVLLARSISGEYAESNANEFIFTLDYSNFTDVISKHDFIVVKFYAPWCDHCKELAPEYEKAASILSRHDPPLILAKIDASDKANRDFGTQYEVQGFPTLKIVRNGGKSVQEYNGPRDAEGIVDYLKRQTGPASTEIKSIEDANSFLVDKQIAIVGVFPEFAGEEFENFTVLAEKLRSDYDFGHTSDSKHLPGGESSLAGTFIRMFKTFDESIVDDFKEFDLQGLEKFIEETSVPIVTVFDSTNENDQPLVAKFFSNPYAKVMLFMNFTNEVADALKTRYREVAEQHKGKGVSFLVGDIEAGQGAFKYFGLKEDQVPLIIIQNTDGEKYLKQNVEPHHIATWFTSYMDGKLPLYKKSEPVPETNNEPVKVVVADTLEEIVFDSGKNVLLGLYAPWCGHCKQLAPILDEIAVLYTSDAHVVIAKLDATENDIPVDAFKVEGFPTIYFKSASGKLTEFDGDRSKEAIVDFIEKNRDKTIYIEPINDYDTTSSSQSQDSEKDEL